MRPPHWALRLYADHLHARTQKAHADPAGAQAALWREIRSLYAPTELGRRLDLDEVRTPAAFARDFPVTTEATYRPLVERVLAENPADWVAPGPLQYVARTSGTTQISKFVAYPPALIAAFKRFETKLAMHTMRALGDYSLLDTNILITSGVPAYEVTSGGVTVGSSSGIMTIKPPAISRQIVRPTRDVLAIADWDAKIQATVEQALPLDIRVMTGIPVFALPILERLLAHAADLGQHPPDAKALWPNLAAYYWSGSPIALYEARLRQLFGPGVAFQEIYSATEAPIAYQHVPGQPGLLLDIENTYFEFQPLDAPLDSARLGVADVEVGVAYRLLVTTYGGLFAYRLGDAVEFLSLAPLLIRVLGRETEELNLASEKVQLHLLREALALTAAAFGVTAPNFFVAPPPAGSAGPAAYHWYVEFEPEAPELAAFARALDAAVQAAHNYYRAIRHEDAVLGPAVVTPLAPRTLDRYVLATRPFGQGKFVHLYGDRQVPDRILAFARENATNTQKT